jgi:very-short-patch-repair endonuclease
MRDVRQSRNVKSIRAPRTPVAVSKTRLSPPRLTKNFIALSERQQEINRQLAIEARTPQGMSATNLERIVWDALTRHKIQFDFRSSMIGGRPGFQFGRQVADFALWQYHVVIEVQGAYWHTPLQQEAKDASRMLILAGEGWITLYLDQRIVVNALLLERWLQDNVIFAGGNSPSFIAPTFVG